jgi:hypothetical protein
VEIVINAVLAICNGGLTRGRSVDEWREGESVDWAVLTKEEDYQSA